jgi:hypothetical protein
MSNVEEILAGLSKAQRTVLRWTTGRRGSATFKSGRYGWSTGTARAMERKGLAREMPDSILFPRNPFTRYWALTELGKQVAAKVAAENEGAK